MTVRELMVENGIDPQALLDAPVGFNGPSEARGGVLVTEAHFTVGDLGHEPFQAPVRLLEITFRMAP